MDFCYDWLLAQIRHDLNKFFLILIAKFARFGPNKIYLKCRNKVNGPLPEYFITFHLHYISFALHYICI